MNGDKLPERLIKKATKLRFDPLDETLKETLDTLSLAIKKCNYLDDQEFLKSRKDFFQTFKTHFSVLAFNINGLSKKKEEFETFLDTLQFNFDVIGLTETHLNTVTEKYTSLRDYKSYFQSRDKNSWGGIAIFIQPYLTCVRRHDLELQEEGIIESLFIEISDKGKSTIVGVIYRPPSSNAALFSSKIHEILSKVKGQQVHLMGDFNLDLLKYHQHQATGDFLSNMSLLGLHPTISLPTRITPTSATIIDNIFTTDFYRPISSGLLVTDISDHLPIFCFFGETGFHEKQNPIYILKRDFSQKKQREI